SAIHHDPHAFQRHAGLGNARREYQLAFARWGRGERPSLACRLDAAVKLVQLDIRSERTESVGGALDLGDAGQEGEERSVVRAKRGADRRSHLRLDARTGIPADVTDVEREALALADDRWWVVQQPAETADVERRR